MHKHLGTTISLATSGVAFVAYPALRPWGDETGSSGAATFGSTAWPIAHALGMLAFVALAFALRSATLTMPWRWTGRPIREAESRMWFAVAMLLPYYGAEAYGLHALGDYATTHHDARVIDVADAFRYAPLPMTTFALGLLALVLVGGRLAHGMWNTGPLGRTGGLIAGLGLASYLPQFFLGPELRIAHGVLLGTGLLLLAARTWARAETSVEPGRSEVVVA